MHYFGAVLLRPPFFQMGNRNQHKSVFLRRMMNQRTIKCGLTDSDDLKGKPYLEITK